MTAAKLAAYIVEDSPAIREGLSETLAELADIDTVGWADNEAQARAWLAQPPQPWDLAVVDLLLRGPGSGLGVLRALQGRSPGQKVVVLTATANRSVREQCVALGCDAVFDKSIDTEALLAWCMQLSAAAAERAPAEPVQASA